MTARAAEGVLITGVYGSGKSSVAAEIGYLLEQCHQSYALLDLDFLGWAVSFADDESARFSLMLRNLTAVVSNYRQAGISVFVLAVFVSDTDELRGIRQAVGMPLRVVRLSVPLSVIEQRLAADVTTERREELREAVRQIAAGAGVGVEDVELDGDRPVGVLAHEIMTWLGWA
jgi:adenylylsulfate kinase-like enzyme